MSLRKTPTAVTSKSSAALAAAPKVALTKCEIYGSDGTHMTLMEPGAGAGGPESCSMDAISMSGDYDADGNFNFSHTLFLFGSGGADQKTSMTLTMSCTVELCEKTDGDSACNKAAVACMGDDAARKQAYRTF